MSTQQREIIEHALGSGARKPGWRNHFATGPDCDHWQDVQELVAAGLMMRGKDAVGGLVYFHATKAGQDAVGIAAWVS